MMMGAPVEIVDKQLGYYNNHDLEGFISTYSEDIKLYNKGEDQPFLAGIEELRKRYMQRFSNPGLHAEIVNRMVNGSYVIDFEHVSGIKENEITRTIAIYEVRDCLIQKVWFIRE